ncbi:hypothetical protein TNIN_220691 [Trichonephila inaurata madagascariensis]|uniref:Secreted protein n=1 Tax=Trichonephila inaurata madagascariensis TaxID=2747483 RepID=A0A8X6IT31_9ARAC|nr:hypothetical protein TNIN_220691 [Trichonephila inaurata madagascariensis]
MSLTFTWLLLFSFPDPAAKPLGHLHTEQVTIIYLKKLRLENRDKSVDDLTECSPPPSNAGSEVGVFGVLSFEYVIQIGLD